jgi:hypothetical protein
LTQLQASIQSGHLKDEGVSQPRLGRLQERNGRAARAFEITIQSLGRSNGKARRSIPWKRRPSWSEWHTLWEGCYLLRTHLTKSDPATLWKQYIELTEAEWAFRIEKDELGIRPIGHHKDQRVWAHILVCFLGYVLCKALAQWMRGAGLGDAPRIPARRDSRISPRSKAVTWFGPRACPTAPSARSDCVASRRPTRPRRFYSTASD